MSITIRFVGGPADGRSYVIPDTEPPLLYQIPMLPPLAEYLAAPLDEPAPIAKADYEPLLDNGWPSRADDGAYLYRHRPGRVTPEDRRSLGMPAVRHGMPSGSGPPSWMPRGGRSARSVRTSLPPARPA
ncbi:hypothetical protein [Streptomyces sp. 4R-3d]|uniref:hypothetical protein n=1 Tax=Streptomyces sp. 4R-3d TaxID=2559605 RepID=UPI001071DEC4|nr:hypothetical protein [Streptomyces sp. 4R-3d]TFI30191.1 hypothetical protein E4P36_05450 [Streptomyces sp. 4R-3d]